MIKKDIVIIGAGIAGISAAIYLKRSNADFVLIDGGKIGGKLNELESIENFPALGKTSGEKIVTDLISQLNNLDVKVIQQNVQTILKIDEGFEVKTDYENYHAKKVILASGYSTPKSLIPGEEKYRGNGVSYCAVCDGNFFKNFDVAVIGNNNVAIEEAIYLSNIVKTLYFVCPNSLIGDSDLIDKIKNKNNVKIIENSHVKEIVGNEFGVTSILLENLTLNVEGVFPYIGEKSTSQILNNLNPKMNGNFIVTDENMMSNINGLYAVGDIRDKKLKQLITACSDGAIGAINASK